MTPTFLDIETADDEKLLAVGWAKGADPVQVDRSVGPDLASILNDPQQVVVCHTDYDLRWLRLHAGVDVGCVLHDTKVMAWLVNENTPRDLETLAARYCGLKMDKRLQRKGLLFRTDEGPAVPLGDAPWGQLSRYCAEDVAATRRLYAALMSLLDSEGLRDYFLNVEAPYTGVVLDMECAGLPIDLTAVEHLSEKFKEQRDQLERHLLTGLPNSFNLRSPQHVARFLGSKRFYLSDRVRRTQDREDEKLIAQLAETDYESLDDAPIGTFVTKREGRLYDQGVWVCEGLGQGHDTPLPSVNRAALTLNPSLTAHPWVGEYLKWKKLDKLIGTYLDVFPRVAVRDVATRTGRIYARFNQTGTATGRLSSSEPNLQNIPARGNLGSAMRTLFRGYLLVGDFSQLEPRLMAHFSQDPVMLEVFQGNLDLYQTTADIIGCTRFIAKVLVLAMGYGAGAQKLSEILTVSGTPTTQHEAAELLTATKSAYAVYFQWREGVIADARRRGYVSTLDGRKRRIGFSYHDYATAGRDRAAGERQAANAVVQGSAADVVRRVMLHTSRLFPKLTLVAQVHDELVWEYDPREGEPDVDRLRWWVERFAGQGISVPLRFEPHLGRSWYTAKQGSDDEDDIIASVLKP